MAAPDLDEAQKVQEVTEAGPEPGPVETPREKLARVSSMRLALDTLNNEVSQTGQRLFVCAYHNVVEDVELDSEGKLNRPLCPECGRPMRHVLSEI